MARGVFSNTNYLKYAGVTGVTVHPVTLSAWVYAVNVTGTNRIFGLTYGSGAATGQDGWLIGYAATTGYPHAVIGDGTNSNQSNHTTGVTTSAWNHVLGLFTSTTSRTVYLNGVAAAAQTTSRTPSTPDRIAVGVQIRQDDSIASWGPAIYVADAAIWNVALTDAEILQLSLGYSPLFVRPASLVAYYPLIRGDASGDCPDYVGDLKLVEQGTVSVQTHPRVFYPSSPIMLGVPAAAPAAGQPMSARGVFVPGMRQWQPGRQPGF